MLCGSRIIHFDTLVQEWYIGETWTANYGSRKICNLARYLLARNWQGEKNIGLRSKLKVSTLDIQIMQSGSNSKAFHSYEWYSRSSFLKKTLICHDCYSLFRDPEVFNACRKNCFYNNAFQVHFSFITIFCLFFIFTIKRLFSLHYSFVF